MTLLDETQTLIADSVRDLVTQRAPLSHIRALRDADETHDPELWGEMIELGWPAVTLPEDADGLGMGLVEAALIAEGLGRNLVPAPLLSSVMIAAVDPDPALAAGRVAALAWREREDPEQVQASVTDDRLTGRKRGVLDGSVAAVFIVSARDASGEIGLFRVAAGDAKVTPLRRMDGRDAADVVFSSAPAARIPGGPEALTRALDAGRVALCAEMLGGMQTAHQMTLAFLRERRQFGVPIGSFQALQHRMVDGFIQIELARSTVWAAARDPQPAAVSAAKALCSEAFLRVCRDAIQLHGGIGMTDEHDIGLYLKRAMVCAQILGTAAWHRDRWARLHGY